jgi:glycosyltransferase involved in cell wall biosynthesis
MSLGVSATSGGRRIIRDIADSVDNPTGGVTYSVRSLCKATADAGSVVELVSLASTNKDRFTGDIPNVKIGEFPISRYFGHIGQRLGYSPELFDYCKSNPVDVLHLHGLWRLPSIVPGLMAIKQNTPYIVSPHGSLGAEALRFSSKKKRAMWLLGQGKVLSLANCLRATAASEVEAIRSFGLKQPIALIPNGVDIPIDQSFVTDQSSGQKYVLWLGRFHPIKGLPALIRAWHEQARSFPDWTLRLVGSDELGHKAELIRLVHELQVPRVSIECPIFGDKKTKLMANANLFVLPSLVENFAGTVAESLAVGVPVICSKGAPWSGLNLKRCGWWVNGDASSLSGALGVALSMSGSERQKMGARGREWMACDFAWDGIGRRMNAVYDWLIGRGDPTDDILQQ